MILRREDALIRENLANLDESAARVGLHRAKRPAQTLGHLGLREPFVIGKLKRAPLHVGHGREGRAHDGARPLAGHHLVGRRVAVGAPAHKPASGEGPLQSTGDIVVAACGVHQPWAARGRTRPVDCLVARNPQQPPHKGPSRGLIGVRLPPERHKGVLDNLLGRLPITQEPGHGPKEDIRVAVVDGAKRGLVATRHASGKGGIVGWKAFTGHPRILARYEETVIVPVIELWIAQW